MSVLYWPSDTDKTSCLPAGDNAEAWQKIDDKHAETQAYFETIKRQFPSSGKRRRGGEPIRLDNRKTSVEALEDLNFNQRWRFRNTAPERKIWGLAVIEAADQVSPVQRYIECGKDSTVLWSPSTEEYRLKVKTCGNRHCPVCGIRRRMQMETRLLSKLPPFKKHEWKFITLTLRSEKKPLKEQLDHLIASFRRMRQRIAWKEYVKHGWAVIEVTWNPKTQMWHPHLHVVCKADYFPKERLQEGWKAASQGSFIADIRDIGNARDRARYLAKYIGKGPDLRDAKDPHAVATDYVRGLKGRRMLIGFGTPPPLPDPPGTGENACEPDDWIVIGPVSKLLEEAREGREKSIEALVRVYPQLRREIDEIVARCNPP